LRARGHPPAPGGRGGGAHPHPEPPHKRRKHSVLIAGHRPSLSIENPFWEQLTAIAARRRISLNKLIEEIDRSRGGTPGKPANLSSSIRVYILEYVTGVR